MAGAGLWFQCQGCKNTDDVVFTPLCQEEGGRYVVVSPPANDPDTGYCPKCGGTSVHIVPEDIGTGDAIRARVASIKMVAIQGDGSLAAALRAINAAAVRTTKGMTADERQWLLELGHNLNRRFLT